MSRRSRVVRTGFWRPKRSRWPRRSAADGRAQILRNVARHALPVVRAQVASGARRLPPDSPQKFSPLLASDEDSVIRKTTLRSVRVRFASAELPLDLRNRVASLRASDSAEFVRDPGRKDPLRPVARDRRHHEWRRHLAHHPLPRPVGTVPGCQSPGRRPHRTLHCSGWRRSQWRTARLRGDP